MGVTFHEPRWLLLLLVAVPAIWAVRWAWPPPLRRGVGIASASIRTVLLAGLLAALAHPVRVHEQSSVSAQVLVDTSASIPDGQLDGARTLVRELASAARPPHELRVMTFAATPAVANLPEDVGPGSAAFARAAAAAVVRPPGATALETDLARALGLAAGLGDTSATRRIALLSDGRATRGDALAQAGHLAALGVRVDVVDLAATAPAGTAPRGDVAVDAITAPEVQPHATFPLTIRLLADRPMRARLMLQRDGSPVDQPRVVSLPAGDTTVSWNTRVERPEPTVFTADLTPLSAAADGAPSSPPLTDAHPENNRGVLAVAPRARPRVLVVTGGSADADALTRVLAAQSIDVEAAVPGRAAGALTAATLARADLVVLADLPRVALPDAALTALGAYVRDGGGLLVTGGPHAFGPGGWEGSPLAALLPVRMDAPAQRDEPALALALVIDRSGSMSGPKMELTREAARTTAGLLPVDDQIAVIAFDSVSTTVVPLQRAANRMRIFNDIGRIQPTGGTNILAGLREGIDALSSARAKKKHVILLTDGQSATEGIVELVDAAGASGITISAVGVGEGADDGLLQSIARRGNGRYYRTRDPATIPRIFTRETSEVATTPIVERPTAVVPRKRAAMLEGLPLDGAPRLSGYVRTHPRGDADQLLMTGDGDPLLARWAVGLGQVAAWTSDLGPRWADAWTRWPSFAKFWGQVARATMRAHAVRQAPLVARLDGDVADVTVEAVGADDRHLSGLEARLQLIRVDAAGKLTPAAQSFAMPESAPGRYQARVSFGAEGPADGAPRPAALLLRAALAQDGRPVVEASGHMSVPFAPELRPVGAAGGEGSLSGAALLAAIAARTGGHTLAAPGDLFRDAPARRSTESLHTPLLLALAALLIADVAVRRLATGGRAGRQRHKHG